VQLSANPAEAAAALALLQQQYATGYAMLKPFYYDPHAMMAAVLDQMYTKGELAWKEKGDGGGYLARTEGSCRFCVNRHWQFPYECRYGKTLETPPPPGFLEKVAAKIVATGKPATPPHPSTFALEGTPIFMQEGA